MSARTSEIANAEATATARGAYSLPATPPQGQERNEHGKDHQYRRGNRRRDLLGRRGDRGPTAPIVRGDGQSMGNVLHHDHAGIDQQADGDRQSAERHRVQSFAKAQQQQRAAEDGEGQQQQDDGAGA